MQLSLLSLDREGEREICQPTMLAMSVGLSSRIENDVRSTTTMELGDKLKRNCNQFFLVWKQVFLFQKLMMCSKIRRRFIFVWCIF